MQNQLGHGSSKGSVLVLWGEQFDEMMAVAFITEFRQVGIQVQIVGLQMRPMPGFYGVVLIPDISLDQALAMADQVRCVVIPADANSIATFDNDPRLAKLLRHLRETNGMVVVGCSALFEMKQAEPPMAVGAYTAVCPQDVEFLRVVRSIVKVVC